MSDESNESNESKKKQELQRVQDQLKKGGVSRRNFLDCMTGLGVGFGAAFLLGMKDANAARLDPNVSIKSTNTAIDNIVKDSEALQAPSDEAGEKLQVAEYFRVYRRGYRRFYRRYYGRYARSYGRYHRVYRRFYARF